MKKFFILLLLVIYILYSSTEKLNRKIKNSRSMSESFDHADGHNYPGDIIESVQSDVPQIKIRFAGTDEDDSDDDDNDATISVDNESEEEEEEDDDDLPIRKKKLSKSKTEDIHSFL